MSDVKKTFDKFELASAFLLGLCAIGAAVAGYQNGVWGGKNLEQLSVYNAAITEASTQYNQDIVYVNADYSFVASAKEHILAAQYAETQESRTQHFEVASYLYHTQLTEDAYATMGLPEIAEADEEAEEVEYTHIEQLISDDALLASLNSELDEAYIDVMVADAEKMYEDAEEWFEEAMASNAKGDRFNLAGVYYTVALFFAGLGLVFSSRTRWVLFGMGAFLCATNTIYMVVLFITSWLF